MNVAGIITEYNPFHRGHDYQMVRLRQQLGNDCPVVCAMSGNWVQRGECALGDKWVRARQALQGGADLILEIPTLWAAASAEAFARGGIGVLAASGVVDTLVFGSESGDLPSLQAVAKVLDTPAYQGALRDHLDRGLPFATCRQLAVEELLGPQVSEVLSGANDNLGIEYLRAMPEHWKALTIARVGVEHDGGAQGGYASASQIRQWLRQGQRETAEPYLPQMWEGELAQMDWVERSILARLRTMTLQELEGCPDSGEGLSVRLLKAAGQAKTLTELYDLTKTKRYAHARIRRLVLWAFLGLEQSHRPDQVPYLRVLGFTPRGQALLREMGQKATAPVLTKPAHVRTLDETAQRVFDLESRCTDLYGLCFPTPRPAGLEWTTNPIRVERA